MSEGGRGGVTGRAVVRWLRAFAAAVAERRDELTDLDAAIGDADHGINMDRGMRAVVAKLDAAAAEPVPGPGPGGNGKAPPAHADGPGPLLKTTGMTLVSTVGGAAGPLYGTFFLDMGKAAGTAGELDTAAWADAFEAGVAGVQRRGKAEAGDKTMLDALLPAAAALRAAAGSGASLDDALAAAAAAAKHGMEATVPPVARKGRASYLGERSAGHQDPGATSSWLLLAAAAQAMGAGADGPGAGADGPGAGAGPGA